MNMKETMNMKKTLLASSVTLAALGLVACGGSDGQDSGADTSTSFTGLVIDGRIAGGTVWMDANLNGAIDGFEPFAVTDSSGYFTYNPITKVNYCKDSSNSELYQYCLNTNLVSGKALIKIAGGLDVDTLEPFKGVMTLETTRADAQSAETNLIGAALDSTNPLLETYLSLISPLTSLMANLDDTKRADIFKKLGIDSTVNVNDLLKKDFSLETISATGTATDEAKEATKLKGQLLKAAYKVQKMVDSMTTALDQQAKAAGVKFGTNDNKTTVTSSSQFVGEALGDALLALPATQTIDDFSETNLTTITESAADKVAVQIVKTDNTQTEASVKAKLKNSDLTKMAGVMAKQVQQTAKTTFDKVSDADIAAGTDKLKSAILATEVVLTKAKKSAEEMTGATDANKATVLNNVTTEVGLIAGVVEGSDFTTQIGTTLGKGETFEVATFTTKMDTEVDGKASTYVVPTATITGGVEDSALASTVITAGADRIWSNRSLIMSGQSQNATGDVTDKGRVIMYFTAASRTARGGDVGVCITRNAGVNEAAGSTAATKDDVKGDYFKGTWQEVGNSGNVVTVNSTAVQFLVTAFNIQVVAEEDKKNFLGTPNSTDIYAKFRFDYDGKSYSWFSDNKVTTGTGNELDWGLVTIDASNKAATSVAECQANAALTTGIF